MNIAPEPDPAEPRSGGSTAVPTTRKEDVRVPPFGVAEVTWTTGPNVSADLAHRGRPQSHLVVGARSALGSL